MSIASLFSMLGRLRFSIPHPCKKTIYLLFGLSLPFLCAAQTTQEQQTTVVADTTIHVEKKNFGQRLKQIITQLNTIDTVRRRRTKSDNHSLSSLVRLSRLVLFWVGVGFF